MPRVAKRRGGHQFVMSSSGLKRRSDEDDGAEEKTFDVDTIIENLMAVKDTVPGKGVRFVEKEVKFVQIATGRSRCVKPLCSVFRSSFI